MQNEISFMAVLRESKSWRNNMDLDIRIENYLKLKPIEDKMIFQEYPKHPQIFTRLFSIKGFADNLLNNMVESGIRDLNKVIFVEYSKEDKEKMVEFGIIDMLPVILDLSAVLYYRSGNDYYVSVFL